MRLLRRPIAFSLLLLQLTPSLLAFPSEGHVADLAEGKPGRDTLTSNPPLPTTPPSAAGKKDAPVDGKDGRPHQGPFIETEAERDRKKALESDTGGHSTGKKAGGASLSKEGWDTDKSKDLPESTPKELPEDMKDMPKSNDGVMDDRNRLGPKEGTRGTEGGISEKSKGKLSTDDDAEKTAEGPKEVPPLPHSEQEKIKGDTGKSAKPGGAGKAGKISKDEETKSTTSDDSKDKPDSKVEDVNLGGISKPEDLPEKPHNIPHPQPDIMTKDDLRVELPLTGSNKPTLPQTAALIQPLHSFLLSLTMILFSEIGDKTFLIAALMAMKHPPTLVLSAAFAALGVMTVLSAILGHALPALLPVRLTAAAAAVLFLVFGAKMLREGLAMQPSQDNVGNEMKEVEIELEQEAHRARQMGRRKSSVTPYVLESGHANGRKARSNSRLPAPPASPPSSPDPSRSPSPSRTGGIMGLLAGVHNLFSLLLSPAWVQTFIMTFLGEWGDRSQIATIAMSTGADYWWVTAGALVGHFACTCVAVVGGRAIAGRVSLRMVTLGGAVTFIVFGFIYLVEAWYQK